MSPGDFLALAIRLSREAGEAEKRSAVSRAYYGVFHVARALLEACDISCPESAEAHAKVSMCLQQSKDRDVVTAGSELKSLRTARNHADYRLSDRRFTDAKFVAIQLGIAQGVSTALARASQNPSAIRANVRNYARGVLKLTVRGDD
jgi:uncharacterized protein (UPF0332 family)